MEKEYVRLRVLLVTFLLFTVTCDDSDDNRTIADVTDVQTEDVLDSDPLDPLDSTPDGDPLPTWDLLGTWYLGCHLSSRFTLVFTENELTTTEKHYVDEVCTQPDYSVITVSDYSTGDPYESIENTYEFDVTVEGVQVVLHSDAAVQDARRTRECGTALWSIDTPQDVTGSECATLGSFPDAGQVCRDIFSQEGEMLLLGNLGGCPSTRSSQLSEAGLVRCPQVDGQANCERSEECGTALVLSDDTITRLGELISRSDPSFVAPGLPTATIPIRIHVIRSSRGLGGPDRSHLDQSLETLNNDFAPVGWSFYFRPEIEYHDDNELLVFDISADPEDEVLSESDETSLNVYYVPILLDLSDNRVLCGVYVTFDDVVGIEDACSLTTTYAHEVGHYFYLHHTFGCESCREEYPDGSNCFRAGDLCCDTPADPRAPYSDISRATCEYTGDATWINPTGEAIPYTPPMHNYMSYYPNHCQYEFTHEQRLRMADTMLTKISHGLEVEFLDQLPESELELLCSYASRDDDEHLECVLVQDVTIATGSGRLLDWRAEHLVYLNENNHAYWGTLAGHQYVETGAGMEVLCRESLSPTRLDEEGNLLECIIGEELTFPTGPNQPEDLRCRSNGALVLNSDGIVLICALADEATLVTGSGQELLCDWYQRAELYPSGYLRVCQLAQDHDIETTEGVETTCPDNWFVSLDESGHLIECVEDWE